MTFICGECQHGVHKPCSERNAGKHTADCDCQHRPPANEPTK